MSQPNPYTTKFRVIGVHPDTATNKTIRKYVRALYRIVTGENWKANYSILVREVADGSPPYAIGVRSLFLDFGFFKGINQKDGALSAEERAEYDAMLVHAFAHLRGYINHTDKFKHAVRYFRKKAKLDPDGDNIAELLPKCPPSVEAESVQGLHTVGLLAERLLNAIAKRGDWTLYNSEATALRNAVNSLLRRTKDPIATSQRT